MPFEPMIRPQFDIRTLLILTAVVSCGLAFAINTQSWLIALLVTILLANVAAVIVALLVYVVLPMAENKTASRGQADTERM